MKLKKSKAAKKYKTQIKSFELIGDGENYTSRVIHLERADGGFVKGLFAVVDDSIFNWPNNPTAVYYSPGLDETLAYDGQTLYRCVKGNNKFTVLPAQITRAPFFCETYYEGELYAVAFSGTSRILCAKNRLRIFSDEHDFYTGVMHGGRFFARDYVNAFKIVWSASHPFDWTEGVNGSGYALLSPEGGGVERLISFGDKLLAIRQCAITVIRACCEPQHFKVDPTATYLVADGIVAETCAVCDGNLYFATKSGIFAFDGNEIIRVENPDERYVSAPVQAVSCGDKYYLVCTDTRFGRRCVFCFDARKKSGYVMGLSPSALYAAKGYACATLSGLAYRFCPSGIGKGNWWSKEVDFGTPSVKYLRRLYIEGEGDITVNYTCGDISRSLTGTGWHTVKTYADKFSFVISTTGSIDHVVAEVEVKSGL